MLNVFFLILPFVTLNNEPGVAFVKSPYATIEDCKGAAEEKINQARKQFRQVKAVCVPMSMGDAEDEGFKPNNGAAVGENT